MSDERVKRNVEDVAYVESADLSQQRPMREVLAELRKLCNAQPKELRERAFRERAGMTAMNEACRCCWPLVRAETESEHQEWCPAHHLFLSQKAVDARR